jgi:hypothetical protein
VDFGREIDDIGRFLSEAGHSFGIVGGVALAAYGHPRLTLDLDFVVDAAAQDEVIGFMEGRGFLTLHRSSGYSNHRHAVERRRRVDFMYVRDDTAARVLRGLRQLPGPGGRLIPVPRPEHLIAMKVHAIKQAPERTWQDMADIGYLVRLDGVSRDEVRGYFSKHGLEDRWRDLERAL